MNTFDYIRHVKVQHTWHIVQYSYQHSVGLEKQKGYFRSQILFKRYFQVILAHAVLSDLHS